MNAEKRSAYKVLVRSNLIASLLGDLSGVEAISVALIALVTRLHAEGERDIMPRLLEVASALKNNMAEYEAILTNEAAGK